MFPSLLSSLRKRFISNFMNYDKQKIEAGPVSETQRAESAANKFFDMAEKEPGAKDPKINEMFSAVGRETAQGNYDMGQRILESGAKWDDDLRKAASEINQLDQERTGAKPVTIEDVQDTITGYARDLEKTSKEKGGRQLDLESAMALDNIAGDISGPGLEGIDNALNYLEGTLKSKSNTANSILKSTTLTPEDKATFLKDWQEKRAMRDALLQEKQKRVEQQKQSQQATEEIDKGRISVSRNLENLYDQAEVPENTPSRQEFFAKVSRMSRDELHFLDAALKKSAAEFGRTRDPKLLDGRLMDLVSKSFKLEDVAKRQKEEDQRKIEEIRRSMGLPEQLPEKSSGRSEEEIERMRKRVEEMMPPRGPREEKVVGQQLPTKEMPKPEKVPESPVYEKITAANLEQYSRQKKEIIINGNAWRIDTIYPDGRIALHRDITLSEAVQLAERAKKGEVRGDVNTPNVKTKAQIFSKDELISNGQWIIEKPPRVPQNSERQSEIDEIRRLQQRLTSGEFDGNENGEFELLMEVFERDAQRLNQERQAYEKKSKK